jgi:hypothetical protein
MALPVYGEEEGHDRVGIWFVQYNGVWYSVTGNVANTAVTSAGGIANNAVSSR